MLDAAGIIHGERDGRAYRYAIANRELLEYISFRERNSYSFLCIYIEKVLKDSGIYEVFKSFFEKQDKKQLSGTERGLYEFYDKAHPHQRRYGMRAYLYQGAQPVGL